MARQVQFNRLTDMPANLAGGMHPETKAIIDRIKRTRSGVLSCNVASARDAKNRMDALRRARASGRVRYKEARRQGKTIYVRIK